MTLSATQTSVTYAGNAATTEFPTVFPFFDKTDLVVTINGVAAPSYVVTGGSGDAGTVTFLSAPAYGTEVKIARATPKTQAADIANQGTTFATSIEKALDYVTMQAQELDRDRAQVTASVAAETVARAAADVTLMQTLATQLAMARGSNPYQATSDNSTVQATGTSAALTLSDSFPEVELERFGAVGDGTTDDTNALNTALAFLATTGGTLKPRAKTYRINGKILIPYVGTLPPVAKNMRLVGAGAYAAGAGSVVPTSGTIFDMRYAGDNHARLDARGLGRLEITGITFADLQTIPSTTPFIQSTGTTLQVHHCAFYTKLSGRANTVDAIVLGGDATASATFNDNINAPFQGYGSVIEQNFFQGIRRAVFVRTFANDNVIRDNTIWSGCGSSDPCGAPFELHGHPINSTAGNKIIGNLIEMSSYPYGVRLGEGTYTVNGTVVAFNGLYDPTGTTQGGVRAETNAVFNLIISGLGGDSFPRGDLHEATPGTNTFISAHMAVRSLFPQGIKTNTLEMDNASTFYLRNASTARRFNLQVSGPASWPEFDLMMTPDGGTTRFIAQFKESGGSGFVNWVMPGATLNQLLANAELQVSSAAGTPLRLGVVGTPEIIRCEAPAGVRKIGFFSAPPQARPTVTGSRGGNAALASLISALAQLGLITDGSSA